MKPKDDQNAWNFWLLVLSAVLLAAEIWLLMELGKLPTSIGILDLVLISLATFRVTRLFVYDAIMEFVRDWFLIRKVSYTSDNELVIERRKYPDGGLRAISELFSCPWCFGLQAAMLVVFLYYLSELSWIVILMFAVGGVATFIQLVANAVGWRAENLKRQTESAYPDEKLKGSSSGRCG
jgi:hypothetical protein